MQRPIAAALAALSVSTPAISLSASLGQESQLAPLVVTATRQATRADRVLSDVTVLTREDIEASGQSSLVQLLAAQPGVEYSATGGTGQPANLFLRGANGNHTLVLLDGMRINSATLGAAAINAIPLAAVDRVEILRGPASSLYGADALGGVVQIFTRSGEGRPRLSASAGIGNRNTAAADFSADGRYGDWSLAINGSRERTSAVSAIRSPDSRWASLFFTTDPYNPDKDGNRAESLSAQARYRLAPDHEIGITASRFWDLVRKDATQCDIATGFTVCGADFDSRTSQAVENTGLFWTGRLNDAWTSTLHLGRSRDHQIDYRFDPATTLEPRAYFTTVQRQLTWQNDLRLGDGSLLLAVEDLEQNIAASSTYVQRRRSIRSLLAGYSAWYGPHGIQANLRQDSNGQFGERTTGGLSYAYQWSPAWRLQGGVKTAFKAPSFNDLYFPRDPAFGGGNPNLKPEDARAIEGGLTYQQGDRRIAITAYQNKIKNLIEWRPDLTVGPFFWTPQNISRTRLRGISTIYDGQWRDWNLHASLDLQDPRDLDRNVTLNNRARTIAKFQADRRLGAWRLGAGFVAASARYEDDSFSSSTPADRRDRLGGYTLVNASAEYAVSPEWSLFGRISNLFDKRYETRFNYGSEGTNLFVGLRYAMR